MRGYSIFNTITKLLREFSVEGILFHPNIKLSCVSRDVVTVLYPQSDQNEVLPKMLLEISVMDLHNDMTKQSDNGGFPSIVDSVTQKVLIIDTPLRSFIPLQVLKNNLKLRQICGYELFIFNNNMQIDSNKFRTRLVTYLQQKSVMRHTRNSLISTNSSAYYKIKCFQMANVYRLLLKIHLSSSHVVLINQRI